MGIRLSKSTTIKQLMDHYPHLWPTLIDLGLMCVGCPADAFHNLADVAKEYGLDEKQLITRLEKAIIKSGNRTTMP